MIDADLNLIYLDNIIKEEKNISLGRLQEIQETINKNLIEYKPFEVLVSIQERTDPPSYIKPNNIK